MAQKKFKDMDKEEKAKFFKVMLACFVVVALVALQVILAVRLLFGPKEKVIVPGVDNVLISSTWVRGNDIHGAGETDLSRAVSLEVDGDGNALLVCSSDTGGTYTVQCRFENDVLNVLNSTYSYRISDNKGRDGYSWCLSVSDVGGKVYFYR